MWNGLKLCFNNHKEKSIIFFKSFSFLSFFAFIYLFLNVYRIHLHIVIFSTLLKIWYFHWSLFFVYDSLVFILSILDIFKVLNLIAFSYSIDRNQKLISRWLKIMIFHIWKILNEGTNASSLSSIKDIIKICWHWCTFKRWIFETINQVNVVVHN